MAYGSIGVNNGAAQNGTNNRELFVKKFATDVLKYFMDTNVARPLITNDSIENGKSKGFPVVGIASAVERDNDDISVLADKSIKATEREIVIGKMTVAHSWISDLDEAMVHYNNKSAQVESIGRALSKTVDTAIIAKVVEAGLIADATDAATAGLKAFDDDVFTSIAAATGTVSTGQEVYVEMAKAMTEFREKDAVGSPVFLLRPKQYFALLNNPANTGLTWVNDPFAQSGKVPMVLGSKVLYSPHFPAEASGESSIGVLFAKESVGILELLSVSIRTDYIPDRLSNLLTGKMAVGYGILNHGSAITMQETRS